MPKHCTKIYAKSDSGDLISVFPRNGYGLKYKERGFLVNKTTTKNLAESNRMTTSALLESTLYITVSARSNG